jgi:hypothetical protein
LARSRPVGKDLAGIFWLDPAGRLFWTDLSGQAAGIWPFWPDCQNTVAEIWADRISAKMAGFRRRIPVTFTGCC